VGVVLTSGDNTKEIVMLEMLHEVELTLPALLENPEEWQSMYIDYEKPYVERLWLTYGDYRVNLHRIHPCKPGEALFHPHPWPSAMRVLGEYEMGVGMSAGITPPTVAMKFTLSSRSEYEMVDPDTWHYVRPLYRPSYSLMITGEPWKRSAPKSNKKLGPLSDSQRENLIRFFSEDFPLIRASMMHESRSI
jgi:hypothetical protein